MHYPYHSAISLLVSRLLAWSLMISTASTSHPGVTPPPKKAWFGMVINSYITTLFLGHWVKLPI